MTASLTEKNDVAIAGSERQESFHSEEVKVDNVAEGDEALKVLHSHFEPYTKEEEKKLLRKIDLRLALLMLVINGLQFVDKLVRPSLPICTGVRFRCNRRAKRVPGGLPPNIRARRRGVNPALLPYRIRYNESAAANYL